MARGPLPNPQRRRRNAPVIPTTSLPASGRQGRVPDCPYGLGAAGLQWWHWAWRLPQACGWSDGDLYVVARRARLEDDLAALGFADDLCLGDLFDEGDFDARRRVEWALESLKRMACGKLSVEREMRDLDDRLGLSPKALAALRWSIVDDTAEAAPPATRSASKVPRRVDLRVVDPSLVESG